MIIDSTFQYCNYRAGSLEEKDSQTYIIGRGMFVGILL